MGGFSLVSALDEAPAGERGLTVVPDTFLRSWDSIIIFFPRPTGPGEGPEDRPERYLSMEPHQPGAYQWLDSRTLRFRPAEPWPPLSHITLKIDRRIFRIHVILPAPVGLQPFDGSTDLPPVESIRMIFDRDIDPSILASMVTLKIRDLPAVESGRVMELTSDDFNIKRREGDVAGDEYIYDLVLNTAVPAGKSATLHIRRSVDPALKAATEAVFTTAPPFRLKSAGTTLHQVPVVIDGIVYSQDQSL